MHGGKRELHATAAAAFIEPEHTLLVLQSRIRLVS
jgi:hypothetical protein